MWCLTLVQPADWKNVETCKETWTCAAMWLLLYIFHDCKSSRYGWFPVTYIIWRWVQGSMENLYFNAPIMHVPRKWTSGRSITARTWFPARISLYTYALQRCKLLWCVCGVCIFHYILYLWCRPQIDCLCSLIGVFGALKPPTCLLLCEWCLIVLPSCLLLSNP